MINNLLSNVSEIYIAYGATDFRKQIWSLCADIENEFKSNPYSNAAFIFCNKKRNSIKVLCYDRNGFVLAQKTLLNCNNMKFKWPRNEKDLKSISKEQLNWLLSGLEINPKGYLNEVVLDSNIVVN